MNYEFSRETFPINKQVEQHSKYIDEDDVHFECTILAGKIIRVECCDTVMNGDSQLDPDITYFQITPDPYKAGTEKDRHNLMAFNNYFYKNYGKHEDRCYFDTQHEAFYNLIKAWAIWEKLLTKEEKEVYNPPTL